MIFDVLYQINFTKPKPLVENAPEKDTVSEKPKFKFRKQSYTIKDPLLDEDPQIFKFKQQKDEAAYAYLLKWLDIGRLILNEAKTSYYNLKQFFENTTPDIYFGVSLGFQIAALIIKGDLWFKPNVQKIITKDWKNDLKPCTLSDGPSYKSYDIAYEIDSIEEDDYFRKVRQILIPSGDGGEGVTVKMTNNPNELSHSFEEDEVKLADNKDGEMVLTLYQLIYQLANTPGFLKSFGFKNTEYFYHKFVFLDTRTNTFHIYWKRFYYLPIFWFLGVCV